MGVSEGIDSFQRRHRWAAVPVAVGYKFIDDEGVYLAAVLSYYGFVSMFPLLLIAVTILGFALRDDPAAQQAVLTSALRNVPVVGDQIRENVSSLDGSVTALGVGLLVALYGALGVTHAAQYTLNRVWAVPKAERRSIQSAYGRGLLLIVLVGMGVLLSATATMAAEITGLGWLARVGGVAFGAALNIGLFLLTYRLLVVRPLPVRRVWVGAVMAGVTWQSIVSIGTHLIATWLQGASASYGFFGIVLGLLAWIYIAASVFVVCSEIDAVLVQRLYPRSLFSIYPDDRATTAADRRAYASYARTERQKDYQTVDVSFDHMDPPDRDDLLSELAACRPGPSRSSSAEVIDRGEITSTGHLRRAVSTRDVVNQAIGIVVATQHCTPAEALDLLHGVSRSRNIRIHDIATDLVDGIAHRHGEDTGSPPPGPAPDAS
jgi:membrane protein